jgi:hypothetical protein
MALAMQRDFVPLRVAWKQRGFDLDLGIGIAQGDATLGAIGFEGAGNIRASAALRTWRHASAVRRRGDKS